MAGCDAPDAWIRASRKRRRAPRLAASTTNRVGAIQFDLQLTATGFLQAADAPKFVGFGV
jgi:hypothetical protein